MKDSKLFNIFLKTPALLIFWGFMGVWVVPIVNSVPFLVEHYYPGYMLVGTAVAALITLALAWWLERTNHSVLGPVRFSSVFVVIIVLFLMMAYYVLINHLMPSSNSANQATIDSVLSHLSHFNVIVFQVTLTFLAPILEETVFRGWLVWALKDWGKIFQYIIPTLLFALAHQASRPVDWLIYGGLGLGLMIVRMVTGRLEYSMATHILWNASSLI
ncbi:type II CAAX endopeptidase family protein [Lactobacillaceae bacterium L1_55_11]|nr:type II CAAX endopeptidase family protein [Lactobacillaceae bacterium L1_55_11]